MLHLPTPRRPLRPFPQPRPTAVLASILGFPTSLHQPRPAKPRPAPHPHPAALSRIGGAVCGQKVEGCWSFCVFHLSLSLYLSLSVSYFLFFSLSLNAIYTSDHPILFFFTSFLPLSLSYFFLSLSYFFLSLPYLRHFPLSSIGSLFCFSSHVTVLKLCILFHSLSRSC